MARVLGLEARVVVRLAAEGLEAVHEVCAEERRVLRRVREHVARVRAAESLLCHVAQPVQAEHKHSEALQRVREQVIVVPADLYVHRELDHLAHLTSIPMESDKYCLLNTFYFRNAVKIPRIWRAAQN